MDFKAFDNSLFPVIVCEDLTVVYRNARSRRTAMRVRRGDNIMRVLENSAYNTEITYDRAVKVEIKHADSENIRFFAFIFSSDVEYIVFVGVSNLLLKASEDAEARIRSQLPSIFAGATCDNADPTVFGSRCDDESGDIFDAADEMSKRHFSFHDFGIGNTLDLKELLSLMYEKIIKRFHVLGLRILYNATGEGFRCQLDVGEYTYFIFMLSYITARLPNASVTISGGDFVLTEFRCDAGDGSERNIGIYEFMSLMGVGKFTTDMLIVCTKYFEMLSCEINGKKLVARLSLPSALAFLFTGESDAASFALFMLDEYLISI